jgi:TetR/AcrR family transcriptional regulator, transcriptional repressor for nem operon
MHEAGLTHGGFYKQFASKQDLIVQACALGLDENLEAYRQLGARSGRNAIKAVVAEMLSTMHRDLPSEGCVMATSPEASGPLDAKSPKASGRFLIASTS